MFCGPPFRYTKSLLANWFRFTTVPVPRVELIDPVNCPAMAGTTEAAKLKTTSASITPRGEGLVLASICTIFLHRFQFISRGCPQTFIICVTQFHATFNWGVSLKP